MTDILIALSTFASAVAAVAIAILTNRTMSLSKKTLALTEATHDLNKAIKASADQFQEDMKKLQVALAAAQLYGATNPQGKSLSTQKLEEYKRIINGGLQ